MTNSKCPTKWLEQFLNDSLATTVQTKLINHLDDCHECRQALLDSAGSIEEWETAAEALSVPSWGGKQSSHVGSGKLIQTDGGSGCYQGLDMQALLQLLSPTDEPRAAGRIGPFEVVGIIGSGGMGIVLKAHDPALDRFVAIKILAPHLASSKSARQRFAREARTAAAVIHENVIEIHQVAHWHNLPYLIMPYVPDPSLAERIEKQGVLDLESILSIGMQIARGLSAAHTQGLVHRDVKPANVLLCKGTARAIITDFGLARTTDDASLTRAGALTGTPHYMSPEQARGRTVDQRSDLFSLGSVLFAMATGRPPVDCELGSETIDRIAAAKLTPLRELQPGLPPWFQRLVEWLHAADPAQRPATAEKVAELLEQCLAHLRQPSKTQLPEELCYRKRSKRWVLAVSAVFVVVPLLFLPSLLSSLGSKGNTTAEEQPLDSNEKPSQAASAPDQLRIDRRSAAKLTPTPVGPLEWDQVEQELRELEARSDELETQVNDLWENQAAGSRVGAASQLSSQQLRKSPLCAFYE